MSEEKVLRAEIVAGDIELMYHQQMPDEQETVFDLDFFIRQVRDTYEAILRQQYLDQYKLAIQTGLIEVDFIAFDAMWLKRQKFPVHEDKDTGLFFIEIDNIFIFPYDKSSCGIQGIVSTKKAEYIKEKSSVVNKLKFMPKTDKIFFWTEGGNRIWMNEKKEDEPTVLFIPNASGELELESGVADTIKDTILNRMFAAKRGEVADTTNDSNPNTTQQTETNKENIIR